MSRVLGIIILILLFTSCDDNIHVENALVHSIPTDSKIIVALSDTKDLNKVLENNPALDQLKSLTRIEEIKKASAFLKDYSLHGESFIALSIEGKNKVAITLVTEDSKNAVDSSSVKRRFDYNETEISEMTLAEGSYYSASKNGVHMASSSLLVLESLIRRNIEDYVFDADFQKLYERTHDGLSFYIKATDSQWLHQFLLNRNKSDQGNYAQWFQLNVSIDPKALHLDGLLTYKDSIKQKHALYNNLQAQENQMDRISPANSRSLTSFTYSDKNDLVKNLTTFYNRKPIMPVFLSDLLSNSQEVTEINLEKGSALAFTLLPYETLFANLDSLSSSTTTYRDQVIYHLQKPIITESLKPLIMEGEFSHLAILDNFLVMAADPIILEEVISNHENGTTIAAQQWWKEARQNMSTSSTLLHVTSTEALRSPYFEVSKEDLKVLDQMDASAIKAVISQYVHEEGYAFYRMEIPFASQAAAQPLVAQVGSYKADQDIIAGPYLFPNHLNGTQDIAFQTEDLQLSLISNSGDLYWTKKLDSQILGDIQAVDIYKNGRKQLVFSTANQIYLLDREGEDVEAFPFKSSKTITQPLSVFDYDNNRNYRFVVTTGDELTLLDNRGNKVRGFNYKKSGTISSSPQHFRKRTKDYIAFATKNNQLKLLGRTGEVRTQIKEKIDARGPLYFKDNLIQLVNSNNQLLQIDPTTGKVTTTKTSLDKDSHVYMTENSQLIQNKNVIKLNGNEVSLPYGTYLPATITKVGNSSYATIVDNGENRIYVIDNKASILPFFPVYGNTVAKIGGTKERYLTTLDGNDVIIYKW